MTLKGAKNDGIDTVALSQLLKSAQKDEVYRIKAVFSASHAIQGSESAIPIAEAPKGLARYILNWAFGRWTCTPMADNAQEHESSDGVVLRMTMILARYESTKWMKRMEENGYIALENDVEGLLEVKKIA